MNGRATDSRMTLSLHPVISPVIRSSSLVSRFNVYQHMKSNETGAWPDRVYRDFIRNLQSLLLTLPIRLIRRLVSKNLAR